MVENNGVATPSKSELDSSIFSSLFNITSTFVFVFTGNNKNLIKRRRFRVRLMWPDQGPCTPSVCDAFSFLCFEFYKTHLAMADIS